MKSKIGNEDLLCYCFGVTKADVISHFKEDNGNVDTLLDKTKITTKCATCALELDLLLSQLRRGSLDKDGHRGIKKQESGAIFFSRRDRGDSGFFLNTEDTDTIIRISNFPVNFTDDVLCSNYRFWVRFYNENGSLVGKTRGLLNKNSELELKVSELVNAPVGWFYILQSPTDAGYYGTARPQVILQNSLSVATFHTQFHSDATLKGRRASCPVILNNLRGGLSTSIVVINGTAKETDVIFNLEMSDRVIKNKVCLPGNGMKIVNLEKEILTTESPTFAILHIQSKYPTKKLLINNHPDGTIGVDHFPNLV